MSTRPELPHTMILGIRTVNIDQDKLCSSSIEYMFPIFPLQEVGFYEGRSVVSHPLNRPHVTIALRVRSGQQGTLFHALVTPTWIRHQIIAIKQKKTLPLSLEPVADKGAQCSLTLIRVGRHVARASIWPEQPPTLAAPLMLQKEVALLDTWTSLHTLPCTNVPSSLSGLWRCPLYCLLIMSDHLDEKGFCNPAHVHVPLSPPVPVSWERDVAYAFCMVKNRMGSNCLRVFWETVDCLACNRSADVVWDDCFRELPFPDTNTVSRCVVDVVACRCIAIDLLFSMWYRKRSFPEVELLKATGFHSVFRSLFAEHWPLVAVIRRPGSTHCIASGLGKKSLFKNLVVQERCKVTSDDLSLLYEDGDGPLEVCMVVWRDYKENVICMSLLQTQSDSSHPKKYDVRQATGLRLFPSGLKGLHTPRGTSRETLYTKTLVRPLCKVRGMCNAAMAVNAAPSMRPWLCAHSAFKRSRQKSVQVVDWHKGWITRTGSRWQSLHAQTEFSFTRQIRLPSQLCMPR